MRMFVRESSHLDQVSRDPVVKGKLTAEPPIIHLLLSDGIQNGVHIRSRLRSIDKRAILAHDIRTSLGSVLRSGKHLSSFELKIPRIALDLFSSLLGADIAACLR